ncbi:hypothetical protein F5Y16DRAFT_403563 [Xylariaceae sp. FL0255]|nr:hypothetical protein F5Y16DRAFT_403563 [Xylariaceae sp. FL0255]
MGPRFPGNWKLQKLQKRQNPQNHQTLPQVSNLTNIDPRLLAFDNPATQLVPQESSNGVGRQAPMHPQATEAFGCTVYNSMLSASVQAFTATPRTSHDSQLAPQVASQANMNSTTLPENNNSHIHDLVHIAESTATMAASMSLSQTAPSGQSLGEAGAQAWASMPSMRYPKTAMKTNDLNQRKPKDIYGTDLVSLGPRRQSTYPIDTQGTKVVHPGLKHQAPDRPVQPKTGQPAVSTSKRTKRAASSGSVQPVISQSALNPNLVSTETGQSESSIGKPVKRAASQNIMQPRNPKSTRNPGPDPTPISLPDSEEELIWAIGNPQRWGQPVKFVPVYVGPKGVRKAVLSPKSQRREINDTLGEINVRRVIGTPAAPIFPIPDAPRPISRPESDNWRSLAGHVYEGHPEQYRQSMQNLVAMELGHGPTTRGDPNAPLTAELPPRADPPHIEPTNTSETNQPHGGWKTDASSRRAAVAVGTFGPKEDGRIIYALYKQTLGGSGLVYRCAKPGASIDEIRAGRAVGFDDATLSKLFEGMDKEYVERMVLYLLFSGSNPDSVSVWEKG